MPDIWLIVSFCQEALENRRCSAIIDFSVSESLVAMVETYPTTLNTRWFSPPERNELILRTTKTVLDVAFEASKGFWTSESSGSTLALFRRFSFFTLLPLDFTGSPSSFSPSNPSPLLCAVTLMKGSTAANTIIFRWKCPVIQSQTFSSGSPPPEINIAGDNTGMWMADTYLVRARYKCNQAGMDKSPYFLWPKQKLSIT